MLAGMRALCSHTVPMWTSAERLGWFTHLSFLSRSAVCPPHLGRQEQQPRCRPCWTPGSSGWWWWWTPPPVNNLIWLWREWVNPVNEDSLNSFYHSLFSSWLCRVEDLVASDVAHCWIPADGQRVDSRVDHLQVLYSTQRSWEGGGTGTQLKQQLSFDSLLWFS